MQTRVAWVIGMAVLGLVVAYFIGVPIALWAFYGIAGAVVGLVIALFIVP
jgi:hypothetical protein